MSRNDHTKPLESTGRTRENRARAPTTATKSRSWRLEPHVCAVCFSRIASRPADDDSARRVWQCTGCGVEAVSSRPASVCACGLKMAKGGKYGTTRTLIDMGVRCHPNQHRTPEFPALYCASYAGAQPEDGGQ